MHGQIAVLGRPAADLPERIEQLIREIDAASATIESIDTSCCEVNAEISKLEQLSIELRRGSVLPLNGQMIEGEICTVSARLERWREIRRLLSPEIGTRHATQEATMPPAESAKSIRAIVSRLEERTHALTERLGGSAESERKDDADVIRHFRGKSRCCVLISRSTSKRRCDMPNRSRRCSSNEPIRAR